MTTTADSILNAITARRPPRKPTIYAHRREHNEPAETPAERLGWLIVGVPLTLKHGSDEHRSCILPHRPELGDPQDIDWDNTTATWLIDGAGDYPARHPTAAEQTETNP